MKKIPLRGKYGRKKFTLVDDEDYPVLSRINWVLAEHGYAKNDKFYLHQLIMGLPNRYIVDHKNHDILDNRKENLRLVTRQHNQMNQRRQSGKTTSIYKGVCRRKEKLNNPWMATICKTTNGTKKQYHLGYFALERDAAKAYDLKAIELFGEYALTNF